jgi:hypothetical protein
MDLRSLCKENSEVLQFALTDQKVKNAKKL